MLLLNGLPQNTGNNFIDFTNVNIKRCMKKSSKIYLKVKYYIT